MSNQTEAGRITLTDFLLARIAEDETVAQDVAAERVRVGEKIDYPFEGEDRSFWADYDGSAPSVSVGAHRVLAECEAKRRIVEQAEESARRAKVGPAPGDGAWFLVARYLALPYADHPDYREEWKP